MPKPLPHYMSNSSMEKSFYNSIYRKMLKRLYKQKSSNNNDDENDKKKEKTPRERGRNFIENIKGKINNTVRGVSDSYQNTIRGVSDSYQNTISQPGKIYNEGKKIIRENYQAGKSGNSPTNAKPYYLGEKMIRGIGNVIGMLEGANEALGNPAAAIVRGAKQTGTRQAQLRSGKTNKRATPVRAKSVSNSRQGGFVNGKPVSIKKMASKNKYF